MGGPGLTDCMSCCVESPSRVSARSYSPVRSHSMTPGSSLFREKLTPSAANLWWTICGEKTVQPRVIGTRHYSTRLFSYLVVVVVGGVLALNSLYMHAWNWHGISILPRHKGSNLQPRRVIISSLVNRLINQLLIQHFKAWYLQTYTKISSPTSPKVLQALMQSSTQLLLLH